MTTDELKQTAQRLMASAREHLGKMGKYLPEVMIVRPNGDVDIFLLHTNGPPRVIVRRLLRQKPATAFVLCSEAWAVTVKGGGGREEAERRRAEMPENLADYTGPGKTECLMMWVCSREYAALHTQMLERDEPEGKPRFGDEHTVEAHNTEGELTGAFLEMRELLLLLQ